MSTQPNTARQDAKKQFDTAKKNNFNGAFMLKQVSLGSPIVKQQFNRYFAFLGRSCFFIHVYAQVLLKDEAALAEADTIIKNSIEKAIRETDKMISVANELMIKGNIEDMARWSKLEPLEAHIVTPQSNAFLRLFTLSDQLDGLVHTLWLEGELDDNQKRRMQGEIRKHLRAVAITAGNTQKSLLRRINEQNKTAAANEIAGTDVIAETNQIVDGLNEAVSGEAAIDPSATGILNVEAEPATEVGC